MGVPNILRYLQSVFERHTLKQWSPTLLQPRTSKSLTILPRPGSRDERSHIFQAPIPGSDSAETCSELLTSRMVLFTQGQHGSHTFMSHVPLLSLTGEYLNISWYLGHAISRQSYLVKASARDSHGGSKAPFAKPCTRKWQLNFHARSLI